MPEKTVFKRIIDGEIPADIFYQDEHCMAFRDIAPQAPTHFLVIPKKEISSLADLTDGDALLVGHLVLVAGRLAKDLHLNDGYRVVINCGPHAGQSVDHLHLHVLAGRPLAWPPG